MNIKICIGSSCHLKGSKTVVEQLQKLVKDFGLDDKINLSGAFCMSKCQEGVCLSVDDVIHSVRPETVEAFFEREVRTKL